MPLIGRFIDEIKILTSALARYGIPCQRGSFEMASKPLSYVDGECNR